MHTYKLKDGIPLSGIDLDLLFRGKDGEEGDGSFVSAYYIWTMGRTAWIPTTPAQLRDRLAEVCAFPDFDDYVTKVAGSRLSITKQEIIDAANLFIDLFEATGSTDVEVASTIQLATVSGH